MVKYFNPQQPIQVYYYLPKPIKLLPLDIERLRRRRIKRAWQRCNGSIVAVLDNGPHCRGDFLLFLNSTEYNKAIDKVIVSNKQQPLCV